MNKILQAYYDSALALKLPVTYIEEIKSLNICLGSKNYFLLRGVSQLNNSASIYIFNNKKATKMLLHHEGIPVPRGVSISRSQFADNLIERIIEGLNFPLSVKPMKDTHVGTDLICDIKSVDELTHFVKKLLQTHALLMIEEYIPGLKEYRVLLLNNRIIAIVERFALPIVGDGVSTIEQLLNINQSEKDSHLDINITEDCLHCLENQSLGLESIPLQGELIKFRNIVNRGLGGGVVTVNTRINKINLHHLSKAAQITGFDLVGFNLRCEDIKLSFDTSKWLISEVDFCPDITLHEAPDEGKKVAVAKKILTQIILRHPFSYLKHRFVNASKVKPNG